MSEQTTECPELSVNAAALTGTELRAVLEKALAARNSTRVHLQRTTLIIARPQLLPEDEISLLEDDEYPKPTGGPLTIDYESWLW